MKEMRFKNSKSKVLHWFQGNPKYVCRLGEELNESCSTEKNLFLMDRKIDVSLVCTCSPIGQEYSGLHQRVFCGQQDREVIIPFYSLLMPPSSTVLRPGVPSMREI